MLYTGIDRVCFEDFLAEFRLTATESEWRETDYALILGAFLQSAAKYFYNYTYHDGIEFGSLCEKIRNEFPCKCASCKQRSQIKPSYVQETIDNVTECERQNVKNKDDNINLYSSVMKDDQQIKIKEKDQYNHDIQDDKDDQDEQSCGGSGIIDAEMEPDVTDEDKEAGVSIPVLIYNLIPESQVKLLLVESSRESNEDTVEVVPMFEEIGVVEGATTEAVAQTEPKETGLIVVDSSSLHKTITHFTHTNKSLKIHNKFSGRTLNKIKKTKTRFTRKTRKLSTHIYKRKIKPYTSHHTKCSISYLIKQSLVDKCRSWKFVKNKYGTILYNWKVRKRIILRIL